MCVCVCVCVCVHVDLLRVCLKLFLDAGGPELPNKILFLTNLPEETSEKMLEMLFKQ